MRDLPAKDRVLGRVLEHQAEAHGLREFLSFKGLLSISYRQLNENANRYANAFLERGITKNAKVAIMLPNCPEYLYSWFGLAKIGAVIVPVNTAQKGELLQYIIDSSDAAAIVTDEILLSRVREIEVQLPKVTQLFVLGDAKRMLEEDGRSIKAISYDLGYPSPAEFSRSFQRWMGLSPRQYRLQRQGPTDR